MTTLELIAYYANLLIYQYLGQPKAYATIQAAVNGFVQPQISTQQISFSDVGVSGNYVLSYDGNLTSSLAYNASDSDIEAALQAISGLGSVSVSGLLVTFTGVNPPAFLLGVESNTVENSLGQLVSLQITETDLVLPLAVQDAFNLTIAPFASGVQLDVLGKYAGVTRSGVGLSGPITLDDNDFMTLIKFAIVQNSATSDLATIVSSLFMFFGNDIQVFDFKNMHMSYLINSAVGSADLVQLLVSENLLPAPMTVQVSVLYIPIDENFFGFVTYTNPVAMNNSPFNDYTDYQMDFPWLDYSDSFTVLNTLGTESGDIIVQENGDLIYLG